MGALLLQLFLPTKSHKEVVEFMAEHRNCPSQLGSTPAAVLAQMPSGRVHPATPAHLVSWFASIALLLHEMLSIVSALAKYEGKHVFGDSSCSYPCGCSVLSIVHK